MFWRAFRRVDTVGQAGDTLGEKQFFLFNALRWVGVFFRAAGVIARVSNAELAGQLAATRLPVVNVSAMHVPEETFPRVATDVEAAGRMAAEYYRERGFSHFADLSLLEQEYVGRQRAAFAAAVSAAGHTCAEFSVGHLGGREQAAARAGALVK